MDLYTAFIDLSAHKITVLNLLYHFLNDSEKNGAEPEETNNEFGWNVSYAKVTINKWNGHLIEYKLYTGKHKEVCHAAKVFSEELDFWRFEFTDRNSPFSPDSFQPSIKLFLKFFHEEFNQNSENLDNDLSLPLVTYKLTENRNLKSIRYSLSVESSITNPILLINVDNEGYLHTITDRQTLNNKHVVCPTPHYPDSYILQKFSMQKENNINYHLEPAENISTGTILFSGFNEFSVKYLKDQKVESSFEKYGFFIHHLRKIITETELLLKFIPTINYHLIKPCNMVCRHCFSDFNEITSRLIDFEKSIEIIEEISKIKSFKKLNFSGGEPTLYKGIDELIAFAKRKGLETSMVTNGYLFIKCPEIIDKYLKNLDLLVLSIDSFDSEKNHHIGRHVRGKTLSFSDLKKLAKTASNHNVRIKVNTVVTKLNCAELLIDKISELKPIRWKILRMLPIKDQNDIANNIVPSDENFKQFLSLNQSNAETKRIKIVAEENSDMMGSYLMISPDGRFFNNIDGIHNYSDPILEVGIKKALCQTPLIREVFYKREGDYSC